MQPNILHKKAQEIAFKYKKCEQHLVAVVAQVDAAKIFYQFGYNSLFSYMTQAL